MAESDSLTGWPRRYGRYLVFEEFARGGMASVHLGRLVADRGFSRLVAVKMLSEHRGASSFYARALEDEARIASRVRHPNVVQPLDVVAERGDVLYVMEYVHGVALAQLLDHRVPRDVTVAIMLDVLGALHAAHEAKDETGRALGVVHRDVSPQNVLVGVDGLARLADFGVAKAMRREERTATGAVKRKPSYMSPEQQRGLPLTRQADVYAAGVVLAVALTGAPVAPVEEELAAEWLRAMVEKIEERELAEIVVTATKPQARDRYATAAEMAAALSAACTRATSEAVGACVQDLAGDVLDRRAELLRRVESADADATISSPPGALSSASPQATFSSAPPPSFQSSPPPPPPLPSSPPPGIQQPRKHDRSPFASVFLLFFGFALVLGFYLVRDRFDFAAASPALPAVPPDGVTAASAVPGPPLAAVAPSTASSASGGPTASTGATAAAPSSSASPSAPAALNLRSPVTPRTRAGSRAHQAAAAAATAEAPATTGAANPARAGDCDPPFHIDSQGRKHYKPECAQ
jgi:serine/threonine-protein kinase